MNSQNHILMITPFFSPNLGGVETHLDDLVTYLTKEGIHVHVVTYHPLTTPGMKTSFSEHRNRMRIYRVPWVKFNLFYKFEKKPLFQFLYLFPGIFIFSLFYIAIRYRKIGHIHGHGLAASVATLVLSKLFRKKSVVSLHTIYKFSERPLLAAIVRRILMPLDNIFVLAEGCKNDLVKISIPEKKISVYTCWVDNKNTFYQRDKKVCRKKMGFPIDKFIVLFVGRLSPEKGVNIVLETARQISEQRILFVLVGDGPMRHEVDFAVSRYGNMTAVGSVPNEDLKFYYSAADILLLGSVDQDYYGRVTMEALSCGLPVILPNSTAYFGKETMVKIDFPQGEIGFMIPPESKSIASLINHLYNDSGVPEVMRNNARSYALEHFSEENANVFTNVYGD